MAKSSLPHLNGRTSTSFGWIFVPRAPSRYRVRRTRVLPFVASVDREPVQNASQHEKRAHHYGNYNGRLRLASFCCHNQSLQHTRTKHVQPDVAAPVRHSLHVSLTGQTGQVGGDPLSQQDTPTSLVNILALPEGSVRSRLRIGKNTDWFSSGLDLADAGLEPIGGF